MTHYVFKTGNPKGVQLTHDNILSNIRGAMTVGELNGGNMVEGQTALVFLPWAHIYGQTCELHAYMCAGSAMALVSR
jgi:long-chain acyl-CoA synthetase